MKFWRRRSKRRSKLFETVLNKTRRPSQVLGPLDLEGLAPPAPPQGDGL